MSLAINGITAVAGTDYLNVNPTVSFNAGESNKTILVTLPFNALNTVSRTATLSLSSPAGGVGVGLGVITSSTLTILHKPDANAVPIIGPIFMSANIGSTAVNITKGTFSGIVVSQSAGGFFFDFSWANGATIYPLYIFTFGAPAAIGATTINYNQGQLMDISKGLSGTQLQSWHVGVVSSTPDSASGTIVIDAIDTVNKRVSGRFSFHAFADVGTTPVTTPAFLEITNGKFRATYN